MPEIDLWKVFASLGVPGIVLGVFYILFRKFNWKFPQVPKKWVGPLIVLFMVLIAGVTFYGLILWAPSSGVTTIRVSLLGTDKIPIDEGQVWTSIGAEAKKVAGGWELEFASSKLPQDRKVIVYAAQRQAHLKGQREIAVEKSKTTSVSIQLERDTSAKVTGIVTDEAGNPIVGATVSITGELGSTNTDAQGFFSFPAKTDEGEEVRLKVTKPGFQALDQYHPAGVTPAYLILGRKS